MASISEAVAAALNRRNGSNDNGGNRNVAKGLAKLLAGGALVAGGARLGAPAMRGLVRVGERTANGRFLNGTRIGRFLKPFTRTALYGDDVARAARKNGILHILEPAVARQEGDYLRDMARISKESVPKKLIDWLRGKGVDLTKTDTYRKLYMRGMDTKVPEGYKGVQFYGFSPMLKSKPGIRTGAIASKENRVLLDNKHVQKKLMENAGLGHVMPTDINEDVIEKAINKMMSDKRRSFRNIFVNGKEDDLRKAIADVMNSSSKSGKKLSMSDIILKSPANTGGFTPDGTFGNLPIKGDMATSPKEWAKEIADKYMVQLKEPLMQDKPSLLNNTTLGQKIKNFSGGVAGIADDMPKNVEYRVHVVNGKVVPYATSHKWDPVDYWNTFGSKRKTKVESEAQKIIDKIVNSDMGKKLDLKNQVLGLDFGFRADGSPILFEMNPSMEADLHGGSGQLLMPHVRNAINAAIKGKMSVAQKLQLAAGAAPVAAGTGMMASGVGNMRDRRR